MGNAVKLAIRRGERRSAWGRTVTQMPEDTTTDARGEVVITSFFPCYGFEQLFELWVCFFEVVDQGLEVIDLGERFVEIAMPQRPFTPPASAGGEPGGTARGGRTRPVEKAVCISYTLA
jgi:hypothetical protein